MLCLNCNDVVLLTMQPRMCGCGKSVGLYLEDQQTTVQSHGSISIGLDNRDLMQAVNDFLSDRNKSSSNLFLRAWINADSEPDVKYVEFTIQEPGEQTAADTTPDETPLTT